MSNLPRVVIDGRMVGGEVPHGMARYVSRLASGLAHVAADGALIYEPVFLIRSGTAPREFAGFQTCEVGAKFLSPLEMIELPRVLKALKAALYHSPTFSSLPWAPCPWIVTVHDLNHLQFGGLREKIYYERLLKPFMRKASAVATVSEFSKKELVAWSGLPADRFDVVYNALDPALQERVDPAAIEQVTARWGLTPKHYFFCLSNAKPHKNLKLLVAAFEAYRKGGGKWDLVLNLHSDELPLPTFPGLQLIGRPSDDQARALIAGAGAVVFPSLYEGFGLPPVEAACLGAPLLVSRIAPHREGLADLVQGEVLWVEAPNVQAWTQAMERATQGRVLGASPESRSQLMRRFSVFKLGRHMDAVYRRVLGKEV